MAVAKVAISLPAQVAASIRKSAREQGITLSRWMLEAAEQRLALEAVGRFVRSVEAEFGPLDEAEISALGRELYGDA